MSQNRVSVSRVGLVLLCLPLCGGEPSPAQQTAPPNWAVRRPAAFDELQRDFKQPDKLYAPFAFWFWDAPLDREQVATMAAEMCRQGFNPGYIHGRWGLPAEQWLSPEWLDAVDASLRATERAGGYLGYCDEYNWPGAQVAGRMLKEHPDLQAMSLKWEIKDVAAGETARLPESFFTVAAEIGEGKLIKSATLTTRAAPSARAAVTAMSPIGPQPLISTLRPATPPPAIAACTAMPNGSIIAAISNGMSRGFTQAICAGTVTYSAKAPSMSMPG